MQQASGQPRRGAQHRRAAASSNTHAAPDSAHVAGAEAYPVNDGWGGGREGGKRVGGGMSLSQLGGGGAVCLSEGVHKKLNASTQPQGSVLCIIVCSTQQQTPTQMHHSHLRSTRSTGTPRWQHNTHHTLKQTQTHYFGWV